jgi:hypothetical protein
MSDTSGPAFPQSFIMHDQEVITSGNLTAAGFQGLSLRDYFAAQAICSLVPLRPDSDAADLALKAYEMADAMLATRK